MNYPHWRPDNALKRSSDISSSSLISSESSSLISSESSSQQTFSFTIRSSSPMIEEDRLSVKEFCEKYKLNTKAEECLETLQFTPGDNLKHVSDQEVKDAGFQTLLWINVKKANKVYRRSLGL